MTPPPSAPRARYHRPSLRVHRWQAGQLRVVVAHEVRLIAPALRLELLGRAQILSQTTFGAATTALAEVLEPDVVVAGDQLADGVIEQFLPAVLRTGARVLLVGDDLDEERALSLLRAGVDGISPVSGGLGGLAGDVLRLATGEAVLPGPIAGNVLREWRQRQAPTPGPAAGPAGLTTREREVLAAMVDGLGTKAVARRLGISPKTAENHKTRVFQKLGVRTQAEAIRVSTSVPT